MTTDVDRRSVASNATVLMGSQVVTYVLSLGLQVVLPRYLGPAPLGQLRLAQSIWALASVFMVFGVTTLLMKRFSRDPAGALGIFGSTISVQYLALAASTVAVGAFVTVAGYDPPVVIMVVVIGVSVAVQPFVNSGRAALVGLERMDRVAILDIVTKVVAVATIFLLIALGADVIGIAASAVVPALASVFLMTLFLRRFGITLKPHLRRIGEVAREGRQYLAIKTTLVAYQQVDIIVISLLVADQALGWYSTADHLFSALLFVPTILMTSLFPAISRQYDQGPERASLTLQRSANVLLLTVIPIALGTIAIAHPLSILLFGSAFAQTGPVLAVFGLVLVPMYLTILLGHYAIAVDRQRFWLGVMVVAVFATIALDLMLVPWTDRMFGNGAIGGAIAYLITESFMVAVGLWKIAPTLVQAATLRRLGRSVLAGAVMFAAVWPLRWHFIALPIAVGVVSYVAMVMVFRIPDADERAAVRRLMNRIITRSGGPPPMEKQQR